MRAGTFIFPYDVNRRIKRRLTNPKLQSPCLRNAVTEFISAACLSTPGRLCLAESLFLLLFLRHHCLLDNRLLHVAGHDVVVAEFHGVAPLAAGHAR